MNKLDLVKAIEERAFYYNWPSEALHVRVHHSCPHGFGRKVGQAITDFASPPPLGGLLQSKQEYQEMRDDDRFHARRLCELRVWIAKLNTMNKKGDTP